MVGVWRLDWARCAGNDAVGAGRWLEIDRSERAGKGASKLLDNVNMDERFWRFVADEWWFRDWMKRVDENNVGDKKWFIFIELSSD